MLTVNSHMPVRAGDFGACHRNFIRFCNELDLAHRKPAVSVIKELQMTTMAEISLDVTRNSDPANLTICINRLSTARKQEFTEFVHHIAVDHQANARSLARCKNVNFRMSEFKLG